MSPAPPRLRRTPAVTLAVLAAIGLVIGRAIRPVWERFEWVAPSVPWLASVALGFLAAMLGYLAYSTYNSLHKDNERMAADRGVRLLVLAQASALVGAVVAGGYLGYAIAFVGSMEADLPRERVIRSLFAAVAAAAVVAGGLFLERACEVPRDDDDDPDATY